MKNNLKVYKWCHIEKKKKFKAFLFNFNKTSSNILIRVFFFLIKLKIFKHIFQSIFKIIQIFYNI